ncbi:MAG: thiamine biosynthesis lipoprotein ApbE [Labilithrix sp.]|nr:thiamine biosynthesis lipoprotein ApbE [Labilithrix sp.]
MARRSLLGVFLGVMVLPAAVLGLGTGACRDVAGSSPPRASEGPRAPELPAPPAAKAEAPDAAAFVPERITGEGAAMGTHLQFAAFTTPAIDAARVRAAFEKAIVEIRRVESVMTTWRPESELSKINAAAGKSAVPVSDETLRIIQASIHTSEISEGTFDITFQSLHGLWKFDEDLDPHPPAEQDIKARLPFVGYKNILVDDANKTVKLAKDKTQISLGGIAKGYAVDRAVAVLDAIGLTSFFVQAGGDLFARGKKPDGSDWQAGIRDPRGPETKYFAKIALSDHAFSTAGDYERAYLVGGKRYHHIIDPRTGHPATACRSVTIWAPSALVADEIDDAVFILGPAKGLALVESLDGVGAVIVDAKNNLWVSKRLQGKIDVVAVPGDGP